MAESTPKADSCVIIPMYNECENAAAIIDAVMKLAVPFDILVIDDSSPDGTAAIVKGKMKEYPGRIELIERAGKLGLGTAYITGFKHCLTRDYEFICEMDADFSHNPEDLVRLSRRHEEGRHRQAGRRSGRLALCDRSECCELAYGTHPHVVLCLEVCPHRHRP